jgi:predicted DsbA family dithiol-disulfide isomerase
VSVAQANAMNERLKGEGRKEGLELAPERVKMVNTFDAHRLIHHAGATSPAMQRAMVDRLFHAYHVEGELLSDHATLVRLAVEVGLDSEATGAMLAGDLYSDAVRADEERAAMFGISGVPFFAIDEKYGVSGAQPLEVFVSALSNAAAG